MGIFCFLASSTVAAIKAVKPECPLFCLPGRGPDRCRVGEAHRWCRNPPAVPPGTQKRCVVLLRNAWWVTQKTLTHPTFMTGADSIRIYRGRKNGRNGDILLFGEKWAGEMGEKWGHSAFWHLPLLQRPRLGGKWKMGTFCFLVASIAAAIKAVKPECPLFC